uniref:Reverse transcriptase zinc-binding domain-containing protein n=1 Tax=Setaria viridis TaxID=4556 RepID=A0A4U6TSB2_SETVI|nr:hypothetical protein SEVIR_7G077100v2 [Setaria viridis]
METVHHLLAECRFTKQIWKHVALWLTQERLHPEQWQHSITTLEWWTNITSTTGISRKATRSLTLLIMWEIWNERNSRIFHHQGSSAPSLMAKIKSSANLWIAAGAKSLAGLLARV